MAALGDYNRQAADLHAGHQPREWDLGDTPTVKGLANSYLAVQEEKPQRGLTRRRTNMRSTGSWATQFPQ